MNTGNLISSLFVFVLMSITGFSQDKSVSLWPGINLTNQGTNKVETHEQGEILWIKNVQEPGLEIFLPTKRNATGKAVIICPGGGYQGLAYDWEGTDIAKWFNSRGIAAFVLKYSLPDSESGFLENKAPLRDAQRAIRLLRSNAKKWNISPDKIGIMGFSAGGHLASTAGTHFDDIDKRFDPFSIDSLSARPDFMILVYPVITMKFPYTHKGSRRNLIGDKPEQELIDFYSNELHVTDKTPPTFIVHASDDKGVPVNNSIMFYQALVKEGVYSEMHIYPEGGHGFSLAIGRGHLGTWNQRLFEWLESLK